MIAVEVSLNGEQLTVAGSDDLAVLATMINASGRLGPTSQGPKSEDSDYHLSMRVGGLTSRGGGQEDDHPVWVERNQLSIGDVVTVRLVEVADADEAVTTTSAGGNVGEMNEQRMYEWAKETYYSLKDKFE